MKRLFFALWPDEETRKKIGQINQQIKDKQLKKFIPDNLHVTLVFLGNIDEEAELAIKQSVKKIDTTPFEIIFDQISFWRKPRVLCLTSSFQPSLLIELVDALKKCVGDCGVSIESRPYKTHITLARKARQDPTIKMSSVRWPATRFALVESVSTHVGVQYKVIKLWPLD